MPPIPEGYKLVQSLRRSGTGETKLAICHRVLEQNRRASSAEILAALEADITVSEVTIDKARQLAETGEYDPRANKYEEIPLEDRIAMELAGQAPPEPPFSPAPKRSEPQAPQRDKIEPRKMDGSDERPPAPPISKIEPAKVNPASALPS
jgi:hypothetical protein